MAINSIQASNSTSSVSSTTGSTTSSKSTEIDFMQLLLAQISHQDPMNPTSNQDMLSQFAEMTTVQELQKLTEGITALEKANSISYAASLIGKQVTAQQDGAKVSGVVDSVDVSGSDVSLSVNGNSIPVSSVISIQQAVEKTALAASVQSDKTSGSTDSKTSSDTSIELNPDTSIDQGLTNG